MLSYCQQLKTLLIVDTLASRWHRCRCFPGVSVSGTVEDSAPLSFVEIFPIGVSFHFRGAESLFLSLNKKQDVKTTVVVQ